MKGLPDIVSQRAQKRKARFFKKYKTFIKKYSFPVYYFFTSFPKLGIRLICYDGFYMFNPFVLGFINFHL